MQVTVHLKALGATVPKYTKVLEVAEGCTIKELAVMTKRIAAEEKGLNAIISNAIITANGKAVKNDTLVNDGDDVSIMPIQGGG